MDSEILAHQRRWAQAVIGDPAAVERFLASEGLSSKLLVAGARNRRSAGAAVLQTGFRVQASARVALGETDRKVGATRQAQAEEEAPRSGSQHSRCVVKGNRAGRTFVEFTKDGPLLTNPAAVPRGSWRRLRAADHG